MPLDREVGYWESIANKSISGRHIVDNSWKRPHQIERLLKYNWMDEKVLEIGVGNGVVAGVMRFIIGGHWDYLGTDLSPSFLEHAAKRFLLNTTQADVTELPGEEYTRIIAFDSLEHVRPEHRSAGYRRIYEVAAKDALLFVHYSYGKSYHDTEFDHPFGLTDIVELEKAGFSLQAYDRYVCQHRTGPIEYAFLVMKK